MSMLSLSRVICKVFKSEVNLGRGSFLEALSGVKFAKYLAQREGLLMVFMFCINGAVRDK